MNHKEKTVYNGEYLGVNWEIQRFSGYNFQNKHSWTFYLYIIIDRIPQEQREAWWLAPKTSTIENHVHYNYCDSPVNDLDLHGGCTWYSKETSVDDPMRAIKVGCDYQHLWDREHGEFTLNNVKQDVIEAVLSFRRIVPDYAYWCRWDGSLHRPCEVVLKENGSYDCGCTKKRVEEAKAKVAEPQENT